jgi:hypothetical protein
MTPDAYARETLTHPPQPPTDIRSAYNERKGAWTLVEMSLRPEAWLIVDDQHVWCLEDLE